MKPSRRSPLFAPVALAAIGLLALACGSGDRDGKSRSGSGCKTDNDCKGNRVCVNRRCTDGPTTTTTPAPAPTPTQRPAQPPAAAPAPAPPPAPAAVSFSRIPGEREWDSVREVTVTGSSRMNCETKKIREWVRVRCHGKNESGSTPKGVTVIRASAGDRTFPFAGNGVTELLFPYVEGTAVDAVFRWSGGERREFRSRWPSGAAEPVVKGEFLGVPPPTDPNRRWPCQSDADCNSPYTCGYQGNCIDFGPRGGRPNKRFPCASDADCNAPYKCGYQGNCMRL